MDIKDLNKKIEDKSTSPELKRELEKKKEILINDKKVNK